MSAKINEFIGKLASRDGVNQLTAWRVMYVQIFEDTVAVLPCILVTNCLHFSD